MRSGKKKRFPLRVLERFAQSVCLFLVGICKLPVLLLSPVLLLIHHGIALGVLLLPGFALVYGVALYAKRYSFPSTVQTVLTIIGMLTTWLLGPIIYYAFLSRRYPQLDNWCQDILPQRLEALPNAMRYWLENIVLRLIRIGKEDSTQKEHEEFDEFFDGALRIVSAYGNVLEATATPMTFYQPITKLPVSKDIIKESIAFLYTTLEYENVKNWVRYRYPEHAERILSEKFRNSLREGYTFLPTFVADEELDLLTTFSQLIPDKETLREMMQGTAHQDTLELARKIVGIPTKTFEIMSRIAEESRQGVTDLEDRCKKLRAEMREREAL